jgi:hypothetical protein
MATMSTSRLSEIIGVHVSIKFLKDLGIKPVFETKNGAIWDEGELDSILMEMGVYFLNKSKDATSLNAPYGYKKNGEPSKKRGRPSKYTVNWKTPT